MSGKLVKYEKKYEQQIKQIFVETGQTIQTQPFELLSDCYNQSNKLFFWSLILLIYFIIFKMIQILCFFVFQNNTFKLTNSVIFYITLNSSFAFLFIFFKIWNIIQQKLHIYLIESFQRPLLTKGDLQNISAHYKYFYVYLKGEEILGFVGIMESVSQHLQADLKQIDQTKNLQKICMLMRLCVVPQARGMGVGKILMQKVIEKSKKLKYEAIILNVDQRNQPAIQLYKKYGFEKIFEWNMNARIPYLTKLDKIVIWIIGHRVNTFFLKL